MNAGWWGLLIAGCSWNSRTFPGAMPDAGSEPTDAADAALQVDAHADAPGPVVSSGTFGTAVSYPVDLDPMDLAIGDFNRDGRPGSNAVNVLLGQP